MSEPAGLLPTGWATTTIDQIMEPLADGRLLHHGWSPQCETGPAVAHDEWGVLKTTAIQPGAFLPEHNKRLPRTLKPRPQLEVRPGDLLLTCAGPRARCGVPCLVRETRPRLILSGKMYRFRAHGQLADPKYLEAYLRSSVVQAEIDRMKTGISDSGLNLTHDRFKCLSVVLAPLPEQHRIVQAIESYFTRLDDAEATLQRVQRNLKRYRASVLKAAVEGRLVPTEAELARAEGRDYEPASVLLQRILTERRRRWEETEVVKMKAKGKVPTDNKWKAKYQEPVAPHTSELPELPEGWCWVGPDQAAEHEDYAIGIGPFGSNLKVSDYRHEGVPLIFVRNIRAGSWGGDGAAFVTPKKAAELAPHVARAGDILITKMGEPPGDAAIYPPNSPDAVITADCIRLRMHPALATTRYVLFAIRSPVFREQIVRITKGVAQKKVSLERFKGIALPLPPLDEQYRIASEVDRLLSVADSAAHAASVAVLRVPRLQQSVLKWAFSGRLVDQDPTDEPASQLLARIRADREASSATNRGAPRRTKAGAKKS